MWNDFTVFADEPALSYDRSLVFGPKPTRRIREPTAPDDLPLELFFDKVGDDEKPGLESRKAHGRTVSEHPCERLELVFA